MSATARSGAERRASLDHYTTPAWAVRAILPKIPTSRVLDPCAGTGSILEALDANTVRLGYEVDLERCKVAAAKGLSITHRCALHSAAWATATTFIFNPPFNRAEEFVDRALREADFHTCVVALLPLNWLAGMKRAAFHRTHPADVFVLPRRPSFCKTVRCRRCSCRVQLATSASTPKTCPNGHGDTKSSSSDSVEYGWFRWARYGGGQWSVLDVPNAVRSV